MGCEAYFPSTESRCLPFHGLGSAPAVAIALSRVLGGDNFVPTLEDGGDAPFAKQTGPSGNGFGAHRINGSSKACVRLLLLQTKTACLLIRESLQLPPELLRATDHSPSESTFVPEGLLRIPRWVQMWEKRAFSFSSALDPLVASAAVHIATLAHLARTSSQTSDNAHFTQLAGCQPKTIRETLKRLRLFDPCVGSGTIIAAARALGCDQVIASDIRGDFVRQAEANLSHADLLPPSARMFEHDATLPFEPPIVTNLVVSNPPWGKNIGHVSDSVAIVRSVTAQCQEATFCWITNGLAAQALRSMRGVTLLHQIPFGGAEVLVAQCFAEPCGVTVSDRP